MFLSSYAVFTLILFLIFALLYIKESSTRREMLTLGILGIFFIPLFFATQAQSAEQMQMLFSRLSIFDILLCVSLSGIAGVIYHTFFGKHYHLLPQLHHKRKELDSLAQWWFVRLFFMFLSFIWLTIFFVFAFSWSTITALFLSAVIISIYLISHRHDLLVDCLASGILTGLLVFTVSTLSGLFINQSADLTFSSPNGLIFFAVSLGLILGPLYEYIRRIKLT